MRHDSTERRRKPIAEVAALVAIVLVCCGAFFGPIAWRKHKVAGLARQLETAGTSIEAAVPLVHELVTTHCRDADAVLAGYAETSGQRAWLPGQRAFFFCETPREARFAELAKDKESLPRLLWVREGREVDARCPPYLALSKIHSDESGLVVFFRASAGASKAWGVSAGREWALKLSAREAVDLKGLFLLRTRYRIVNGERLPGVDTVTTESPFGLAEIWFRKAGGSPRDRRHAIPKPGP